MFIGLNCGEIPRFERKIIFMKGLLLTVFGLVICLTISAQQEYQVSHNMFNNAAINPAAAGLDDAICGHLIGRQQWMGFEGAPQTYVLNANAPLSVFTPSTLPIGLGVTMFYDQLGLEQNILGKLSANYQHQITTGKIIFGLDLGLVRKGINGSEISPIQMGDNSLAQIQSNLGAAAPSLGFGVYYHSSNLEFGIASSQLIESTIDWQSAQPSLRRHYYISGMYTTKPIASNIVLKPSVFIKTDGSVTTMDIGGLAEYNSMFWVGATYRTGDAIVALAGYNITNNLKFGLAYDYTTSDIRTTSSSGSVEVFMKYCYPIKKPSKRQEYRDPSLLQ